MSAAACVLTSRLSRKLPSPAYRARRGCTRGRQPSCGGSRRTMRASAFGWRAACCRRGGNPPAPACPRRGKRERGRSNSLLPQAFPSFAVRKTSFARVPLSAQGRLDTIAPDHLKVVQRLLPHTTSSFTGPARDYSGSVLRRLLTGTAIEFELRILGSANDYSNHARLVNQPAVQRVRKPERPGPNTQFSNRADSNALTLAGTQRRN